jgi:hypothetical protein
MIRVHKNRLWAAGDPDHPSRLFFSEILNAEQWEPVDFEDQNQDFLVSSDAGWLDIEPNDGHRIRALGPGFRDLLPIYKDHAIHLVSGNSISDFAVQQVNDAVGCVGHFAVTNAADDQFFVSRAGVHALSASEAFGALEQTIISRDIRDYWNEEINVEALQQSCYLVDNEPLDRLEVLVPTYQTGDDSLVPNRILCLNYGVRPQTHPFGLWSIKKIKGRSMATTRLQGSSRERVVVGSTDGFLNLQDQASAIDFPSYGVRTVTEVAQFRVDVDAAASTVEVDLEAKTVDTADATLDLGIVGGNRTACGMILESSSGAVIPQGANIVRAYFTFIVDAATNRYVNLRFWGELDRAPSVYSTYADFIERTLTNSYVDVADVEALGNETYRPLVDFAPIIQEIVNLSSWVGDATDKIALQIWDNGSFGSPFGTSDYDNVLRIFDTAQVTGAQLYVEYWA